MLAEMYRRNREKKIAEEREKGRLEARRQIGSRLERMTVEERMAEVDRLIAEARNNNKGE